MDQHTLQFFSLLFFMNALADTVWIDQNGQNEIMAFLACLFDANQLLLKPFYSQGSQF